MSAESKSGKRKIVILRSKTPGMPIQSWGIPVVESCHEANLPFPIGQSFAIFRKDFQPYRHDLIRVCPIQVPRPD